MRKADQKAVSGQGAVGQQRLRHRPQTHRHLPLSYIDGVTSIRIGPQLVMHPALEEAAEEVHIKWDHSKDWGESGGKYLGEYIEELRKH